MKLFAIHYLLLDGTQKPYQTDHNKTREREDGGHGCPCSEGLFFGEAEVLFDEPKTAVVDVRGGGRAACNSNDNAR